MERQNDAQEWESGEAQRTYVDFLVSEIQR